MTAHFCVIIWKVSVWHALSEEERERQGCRSETQCHFLYCSNVKNVSVCIISAADTAQYLDRCDARQAHHTVVLALIRSQVLIVRPVGLIRFLSFGCASETMAAAVNVRDVDEIYIEIFGSFDVDLLDDVSQAGLKRPDAQSLQRAACRETGN